MKKIAFVLSFVLLSLTVRADDFYVDLHDVGDSQHLVLGKIGDSGVTVEVQDDYTEGLTEIYSFELRNIPDDYHLCDVQVHYFNEEWGYPTSYCVLNLPYDNELSFSFQNLAAESFTIEVKADDHSHPIWDGNDGIELLVSLVEQHDEIQMEPGNVYVSNFGAGGGAEMDIQYLLDSNDSVDIGVELSGVTGSSSLDVRVSLDAGPSNVPRMDWRDAEDGTLSEYFDNVSPEYVNLHVENNDPFGIGPHVKSLISIDEKCTSLAEIDQNYNHRYDTTCESNQHANRYASYFMFYVPEIANFNIGVWSNKHVDLDNVVYLYKGYVRDGELIASDDNGSNRTPLGAQITDIGLLPGWYTVESTTAVGRKNGRPIFRVAEL